MAQRVAGGQYFDLDGQLCEIKRQLRQLGGYPFDPERLKTALQEIIEGRFMPATYPADGQIFELTLDGDAPENEPIEMVRRDGYGSPEQWKFTGKKVTGKQTRHFKLVSVGYCSTFEELTQKLAHSGAIPEGQWREAFKASYPQPDGEGPVGVADPSWVNPCGYSYFPFVNTSSRSDFYWADDDFRGLWRWLVAVGK